MKKSILLMLVLVIVASTIPLFASTYYEKGNTFFSLNVGVLKPSVSIFPKAADPKASKTIENLKLGGIGNLSYQGCVAPMFAIGGAIGYTFNYVIDGYIFTQVPISAKLTFIPLQTGKFDINIHTNLGIEFLRYLGTPDVAPFASVEINPVLYISENWGISLNAGYSMCYEYKKIAEQSSFYGQMLATLGVTYRR